MQEAAKAKRTYNDTKNNVQPLTIPKLYPDTKVLGTEKAPKPSKAVIFPEYYRVPLTYPKKVKSPAIDKKLLSNTCIHINTIFLQLAIVAKTYMVLQLRAILSHLATWS